MICRPVAQPLCGYCQSALHLLGRKGVTRLNHIDVDAKPWQRAATVARSGRHTVPQIFIGDTHVGGFDDLAELERAGRLDAMPHRGPGTASE